MTEFDGCGRKTCLRAKEIHVKGEVNKSATQNSYGLRHLTATLVIGSIENRLLHHMVFNGMV